MLIMPFELINAQSNFMKLINYVLRFFIRRYLWWFILAIFSFRTYLTKHLRL